MGTMGFFKGGKLKPPTLIVALDTNDRERFIYLADTLKTEVSWFKVGLEAFTSIGSDAIKILKERQLNIFADVKFHDIPHTVEKASKALTNMGVRMFNVHALGGIAMMKAARVGAEDSAENSKERLPLILGVTLLTSMDGAAMTATGITGTPAKAVARLAGLAYEAGLDGVVCSAMEVAVVKKETDNNFITLCPGIRPFGSLKSDQVRVATPVEASQIGADFIVVGRPITESQDPLQVVLRIKNEINRVT